MHVIQPLAELFRVPDKPVPELVLPKLPGATPLPDQAARRDVLDVLHEARNGKTTVRPEEGVPMVRHQDVSAQ